LERNTRSEARIGSLHNRTPQIRPGFGASRILRRTGHNHLLDAPAESADQILAWIRSGA
jgi:hypothetical protein